MHKPLSDKEVDKLIEEQEIVKQFIQSGKLNKAELNLKHGFLLISIGNSYIEEAIEELKNGKLLYGKLKTKSNNFINSFDSFEQELFKFLGDESRKTILADYDSFSNNISNILNKETKNNEVTPKSKRKVKPKVKNKNFLCTFK